METRRNGLAAEIRIAHPEVQVRTSWMSCDFPIAGIELFVANARTGEVLAASRTDAEIATMTDAEVRAWADEAIGKYAARAKRNAHARAVCARIDREN